MMKLLVTGARGFIGTYLVEEALRRGYEVVAMSRSEMPPTADKRLEWLCCDLCEMPEDMLVGRDISVVVHLAAEMSESGRAAESPTLQGTGRLLRAMEMAGIHRLIGVSSLSVLDYHAMPSGSMIDETVPVAGNAAHMGNYAVVKAEQEQFFLGFSRQPGRQCVILRPGLVYDGERMIDAHAGIIKGPFRLLASHDGEVPVIHVDRLVDLMLLAVENSNINGEIVHAVDDSRPGQKDYIDALRRRGLIPGAGVYIHWRVLAILSLVARAVLRLLGKGRDIPEALRAQGFAARLKPFRFSNAKARRLLHWAPGAEFD